MITADTLVDSDRSAISESLDRWLAALNAADIGGLVADAAADVMIFPPKQPGVFGAAALGKWHEEELKQAVVTIGPVTTEEIIGSGTFALLRFSYTLRVAPRAGGPPIEDRGTCFWIWRREQSGQWVIPRALWNSSNPLSLGHSP